MRLSKHWKWLYACIAACGLILSQRLVYADDYIRDPAPAITSNGTPVLDFATPKDPQACDLYLENLRYFARRKEPLSCGQPVAPTLKNKIHPVEWENLDPDKYPELFKALVRDFQHLNDLFYRAGIPDERVYALSSKDVKGGAELIRRANLNLRGFPAFFGPGHHPHTVPTERPFHIIQFGFNVLDPHNPSAAFRCEPQLGRRMRAARQSSIRFYVAREDLQGIYGGLSSDVERPIDLWLINGEPYGEFFNEKGDVWLSQFRFRPSVTIDAICLYHFKETLNQGKKP